MVENALGLLSQHPALGPVIAAVVLGVCGVIGAFISRGGSDRRLKRRRNKLDARLKLSCPHVEVDYSDGKLSIVSLCFSVAERQWWMCMICQSRFPEEYVYKMLDQWLKGNLEEACRDATESLRKAELLRHARDELGYD